MHTINLHGYTHVFGTYVYPYTQVYTFVSGFIPLRAKWAVNAGSSSLLSLVGPSFEGERRSPRESVRSPPGEERVRTKKRRS